MTIPDSDTAADTHFAVAEQSIAVLRKRDGTEMSVTVAAPSDFVRNDLDTVDMNVEVDLDATQVSELVGKNWKNDDVTKDMMSLCADDAASKAARDGTNGQRF